MRSVLLVGSGLVLLAIAFVDVFAAVLHYDRHGPVTQSLYRGIWAVVRAAARALPRGVGDRVRSLGLPLMVVGNVVLWAALFIAGFALLYLDGFDRGAFTFSEDLEPTLADALYLSGATMSTLGFGDLTPSTPAYQGLAVVQAFTGFGILTLTLSYLIAIYQTLQDLNVLTASLQHQSDRRHGDHAIAILQPHFPRGRPRGLSERLQWVHLQLVGYHEALHRYPIVHYFCSDRPYSSMPYLFLLLGEIISALRWGLPADHEVTEDPWLLALVEDYRSIMRYVDRRFGAPEDTGSPEQVSLAVFVSQLDTGRVTDPGIVRFLAVDEAMRAVVRDARPVDPQGLYDRYAGWLAFARPASAFVRHSAQHLAYDVALLDPDHDRQLL